MSGFESQEHHLLFALLAFQNDFISRTQLLQAFSAWMGDKSPPLDDILVQQAALSQEDRQMFERLVAKHLERFGGDAAQSLANLSGASSIREELTDIADGDGDMLNTLTLLPAPSATQYATIVGDSQAPSTPGPATVPSSNRFRILRQHARGGLGVVFLAEDQDLSREVAMKQIRNDRADEEGYRVKFLQEAEVTGQLEHPGIVPVYALGTDTNGRPFYAMRFIRGEDLQARLRSFHQARKTNHSRLDGPELRALLRRFVDVCNAIQYAHDRGVLHRDLKPGNVMLGKHGETLVVDWGLAKPFMGDASADPTATVGPTVTAASFRTASTAGSETRMGTFVGTPAYSPPEQVMGELDRLGPWSDVYALGAILYEVLTGKVPVSGTSVEEVITKAKTGNFPPPREIEADIPRPLEAICRKAMAVDLKQRYTSAELLRQDIESWLDDTPIAVYREPMLARIFRVIRKNPVAASWIAATLLMGLLGAVGFGVVSSNYNRQLKAEKAAAELARDEEREARELERLAKVAAEQAREAEFRAKEAAVLARNQAVKVRDFLVNIFQQPDPSRDGRQITVFDSMVSGIDRVRTDFADDPETAIALLTAIYQSFSGLGLYQDAAGLIEEVLELRQSSGLDSGPEAIEDRNNLGKNLKLLGKYTEAVAIHEYLLQQCLQQLGESNPLTLQVQHDLANAYRAAGRMQEALRINRTVHQKRLELLGREHPDTLSSQNTLANSLQAIGDRQAALAIRLENLEGRKKVLGVTHPDTLSSQNNLAVLQLETGNLEQALELARATYAARSEVLELKHPDTLASLFNLANVLLELERTDTAQSMYREAVSGLSQQLSPTHPSTLTALLGLGRILLRLSAVDEAHAILLRVRAAVDESNDVTQTHPLQLACTTVLAETYDRLGQPAEAVRMLEEAIETAKRELGAGHERTLELQLTLSAAYPNNGQLDELDLLCQELAPLAVQHLGPSHPIALKAQNNLASSYLLRGEYELAWEIYRGLQTVQRHALGEQHAETIRTELGGLQALRIAAQLSGDLSRLEAGLEQAVSTLERTREKYGPGHTLALEALEAVGLYQMALEQFVEAKQSFADQLRLSVQSLGVPNPSTLLAGANLVAACEILGDWQLVEAVAARFAAELAGMDSFRAAAADFSFRRGYAMYQLRLSEREADELMTTNLARVEARADPPNPPWLSADEMRLRLHDILVEQGRDSEAAQYAPLQDQPIPID